MIELNQSGVAGLNGFSILALSAEEAGRRAPGAFGSVGSLEEERRQQRELVETLRVAEERWLEVPEVLRLAVTKAT